MDEKSYCPFCYSSDIRKYGLYKYKGAEKQKWMCNKCNHVTAYLLNRKPRMKRTKRTRSIVAKMKFTETKLKGAYIIELEPVEDERGFFARSFCQKEFKEHGLNPHVVQCNVSYNYKAGTIRGMHHQLYPYEEIKLVQCTAGAIFDVMIDLRPESSTFKQWFGDVLTAEDYKMFYVPKGFAHGYLALKDSTTVFYHVSEFYHPECERTICWDDPTYDIVWPKMNVYIVSPKDQKGV